MSRACPFTKRIDVPEILDLVHRAVGLRVLCGASPTLKNHPSENATTLHVGESQLLPVAVGGDAFLVLDLRCRIRFCDGGRDQLPAERFGGSAANLADRPIGSLIAALRAVPGPPELSDEAMGATPRARSHAAIPVGLCAHSL